MPGQDGIVTLRRIKKEFPGVRVIAVSGGDATGRIDLRKDAELLGAARTLRKPLDRKSTRLNSSHGYISYAVFCLKKKKNPTAVQRTDRSSPERTPSRSSLSAASQA